MIPFSVDAQHTQDEVAQFASQLPLIPEAYQPVALEFAAVLVAHVADHIKNSP